MIHSHNADGSVNWYNYPGNSVARSSKGKTCPSESISRYTVLTRVRMLTAELLTIVELSIIARK